MTVLAMSVRTCHCIGSPHAVYASTLHLRDVLMLTTGHQHVGDDDNACAAADAADEAPCAALVLSVLKFAVQ
jgi:hypothetical protein